MTDSHRKFVSVIVPVYKDWHKAERCIEALSLQTYPRDWYEIIVVDNDESSPGHQLLHDCILISEPKPGSYAARNAGLQIAKGRSSPLPTPTACQTSAGWKTPLATWLRGRLIASQVM
ncbi:glycosyltransferase [Modicisalibacter luteus]|uniref:glycosyltransferase n=1 Tax=Modicisalibacter luteus TaxID=453962 RepID=UPI0036395DCF